MAPPFIRIDLDKIERNARAVVSLCAEHGIRVTGVTKGVCGSPEVARAMLRGGCSSLGEARLRNVSRLRRAGIEAPILLLRMPALSDVDQVVAHVDLSLQSELAVLQALSSAAQRRGRRHPVIVMVDLGDLREGVWPDELPPFVEGALELPGIQLVGIGSNLSCYGGVLPSERNMGRLVACAEEVERRFGVRLPWISGGNSSSLPLIAAGAMPPRIDHVRIGEAILLGRETGHHAAWPGTVQDAFVLHGEVLELKEKPSLPVGARGEDAFGRSPDFVDRGAVQRVLLNLGREDVDVEALTPLDPRVTVLGASSDYLIVDVSRAEGSIRIGDELCFALGYGALLAAMDSQYVDKRYIGEGKPR